MASPEFGRAMETACRLASARGASITVVRVIEVSPLLPLDARMADEEAEARRLLACAEATADAYGVRAVTRTVRAREAGTAILELAEREDTELVVIGAPRGRRGYGRRRMVFSGTVRHVLQKARCRVLVVSGPLA